MARAGPQAAAEGYGLRYAGMNHHSKRPDPPLDTTGRDLSSAPVSAGTALMTTDQRRT